MKNMKCEICRKHDTVNDWTHCNEQHCILWGTPWIQYEYVVIDGNTHEVETGQLPQSHDYDKCGICNESI